MGTYPLYAVQRRGANRPPAAGCRVALTEHPDALANLQGNVAANAVRVNCHIISHGQG
jgi:hypothetical protein